MILDGCSGNRSTEKVLPSVLLISNPRERGGSTLEDGGFVLKSFMRPRFLDIVQSLVSWNLQNNFCEHLTELEYGLRDVAAVKEMRGLVCSVAGGRGR
jgi:hypothetical protein